MFKDEYKKLLDLLEKNFADLQNFNLEEVLLEAGVFFEELRKSYPQASVEERQEMLQMMVSLQEKLQEASKKMSETTGLSEEEMRSYMENPNNFPAEQWRFVQESRTRLNDSARKFAQALEKEKNQPPSTAPEAKPAPKNPKSSKPRRPRRDDWMKS